MTQLNKKIAIVTGAGGGFGEGIAQAYVREGARVIVADINAQAAQRVADALGAHASPLVMSAAPTKCKHWWPIA